jgi:hypothetical protein
MRFFYKVVYMKEKCVEMLLIENDETKLFYFIRQKYSLSRSVKSFETHNSEKISKLIGLYKLKYIYLINPSIFIIR